MNLKMFKSESAVSPVIGIILMLGLTILSISTLLIYSVPTLGELEDMAKAQKVEQAFTVFDSRTSKVALGESPIQTTYVSLMGGTINVNGDQDAYNESKIVIVTVNINASGYDDFIDGQNRYRWQSWKHYLAEDGFDELNCSLGSIEYSLDDRIIAYEGGGVWSKYPTGGTIMISPPEFHYNGETLTLPLMKINGRSGVSGTGDVGVSISSDNMPIVLYPNTTMSGDRVNPLKSDKVIIYIKSEFYDAWANYANSQTYTSATVDAANKTAIIELDIIPPMGESTLTDAFKVGTLNSSTPSPIYNFSFNFVAGGSQGLKPSNYRIFASSGTKTLTYTLQKTVGLTLDVEYQDSAAGSEYIERWLNIATIPLTGTTPYETATIDFLSDNYIMKYSDGNTNDVYAEPDFSWGQISELSTLPDLIINDTHNQSTSLNNLTQHYMKLLTMDGSVIFSIDGGSQDPVNYEESTITLNYEGMPGAITYLHITKNELDAAVTV
ncbi:MAG TPA: hypothetical protein C5S51_04195 [Methanosarcinaceae archaeon]|nr:hypothetical protein [Methanosarcinaceae archaeon]